MYKQGDLKQKKNNGKLLFLTDRNNIKKVNDSI